MRAGQLDRLGEDEDYVFHFESDYLETPQRPVLGQQFLDRMPDDIVSSGLPVWFSHLLPQGPSRRLLQRWAGLDLEENDSFELLLAIGSDLPGAVVLEPAVPRTAGAGGYAAPLDVPADTPGFSLPGAQYKLSAREGERGLVIPARGEGGDVIAKFHDPVYPGLPRLEWATTEWARRAGLRTHQVRLGRVEEFSTLPEGLEPGDGTVLVARRFDRRAGQRVHVEDFGQIVGKPPGNSQYLQSFETIGAILSAITHPERREADLQEYIERLVFMIVCGNGDAHLKNWGVIYPDRRQAELGPAYDLVSTICHIRREELALTLDGGRDFYQVGERSFHSLAARVGLEAPRVERWVREAKQRSLAVWAEERVHLELTEGEREAIDKHIATLRL